LENILDGHDRLCPALRILIAARYAKHGTGDRRRMDFTISNNAKLFAALLEILSKHYDEPDVAAALCDLNSAKANHVQRSIDHLMNCLILTFYDLAAQPLSRELQAELRAVLHRYVTQIFQAGERLNEIAHQYEADGGKLLSREEILSEIEERRGTNR
jgi:hypothetical protein